jgi:hypothetical protein
VVRVVITPAIAAGMCRVWGSHTVGEGGQEEISGRCPRGLTGRFDNCLADSSKEAGASCGRICACRSDLLSAPCHFTSIPCRKGDGFRLMPAFLLVLVLVLVLVRMPAVGTL